MWGVWFLVRVFLFERVARLSQSGQSGLCVVVVAIVGISIWFASAVCRISLTLLSSLCRQEVCSFSTVCMSASLSLMALSMAVCWGEESCRIGSITGSCVGALGIVGGGGGWGASVVAGGTVWVDQVLRQSSEMLSGPGAAGGGEGTGWVADCCIVFCVIVRWCFCRSVAGVNLMQLPP